MKIEYLTPLRPEFVVNPYRGRRWRLVEPFEFLIDGKHFVAPMDFWTDFASVPRLLWPIISPYDLGVGPVPHDLGYFTGYRSKAFWDEVLWACMEKDGIPAWKRKAAYQAVSWCGWGAWNGYRRKAGTYVMGRVWPGTKMEVVGWGERAWASARDLSQPVLVPVKGMAWKYHVEALSAIPAR